MTLTGRWKEAKGSQRLAKREFLGTLIFPNPHIDRLASFKEATKHVVKLIDNGWHAWTIMNGEHLNALESTDWPRWTRSRMVTGIGEPSCVSASAWEHATSCDEMSFLQGGCVFLLDVVRFVFVMFLYFFSASVGFWLLLASGFYWLSAFVGILALLTSISFWLFGSVGFWLLLAFGFCWLFGSVGFCLLQVIFMPLLLLVLFCWWWRWWREQPGLHAWGGGAAPSPQPLPALRSLILNSMAFLVLFVVLFLVVCYILFLVCICWWFAIACYIVCHVVCDNVCAIILYDILYDPLWYWLILVSFATWFLTWCCFWLLFVVCSCLSVILLSNLPVPGGHCESGFPDCLPSRTKQSETQNAVKSNENIKSA